MSGYANAAKKMVPNIPAGGGGFFLGAVGLATGAYGLYHSVVTGIEHKMMLLIVT